jgi:hypothetical protein
MNEKQKRPYTSRYTKFENNNEGINPELYLDDYMDMVDDGLNDRDIAQELNINEKFFEGMKKDIYEEY